MLQVIKKSNTISTRMVNTAEEPMVNKDRLKVSVKRFSTPSGPLTVTPVRYHKGRISIKLNRAGPD